MLGSWQFGQLSHPIYAYTRLLYETKTQLYSADHCSRRAHSEWDLTPAIASEEDQNIGTFSYGNSPLTAGRHIGSEIDENGQPI
jgi:hypothetical protein